MIDGLEGRQRTAELLAAVQVRNGLRDCTRADAPLDCGQCQLNAVDQPRNRGAVSRTDQLRGGTGKGDVGTDLPTGGLRLFERHSLGTQVDQQQCRTGGSGCRNESKVCDVSHRHYCLLTRQSPIAVGVLLSRGQWVAASVRTELFETDGQESTAVGNSRKEFGAKGIRAEFVDSQCCKGRFPDRHGRNVTSLLFEQCVQLGQAEATAAELLRQGDTEQAGAREFAPQFTVDALGGEFDLLGALDRCLAGEDLVGQCANCFLLFAEIEVHQCSSRTAGRNAGSVRSGSASIQSSSTGMSTTTSSGAIPTMLAINRVPSSSSITATMSG